MAPVQFQILSDLHLETHPSYNHFKLEQSAPYLALLGEIGHAGDDRFLAFLERQVKRYWAVFFLFGNHYILTSSHIISRFPPRKPGYALLQNEWNVCAPSQLLGNSFSLTRRGMISLNASPSWDVRFFPMSHPNKQVP
jgi:hypothetical protein